MPGSMPRPRGSSKGSSKAGTRGSAPTHWTFSWKRQKRSTSRPWTRRLMDCPRWKGFENKANRIRRNSSLDATSKGIRTTLTYGTPSGRCFARPGERKRATKHSTEEGHSSAKNAVRASATSGIVAPHGTDARSPSILYPFLTLQHFVMVFTPSLTA